MTEEKLIFTGDETAAMSKPDKTRPCKRLGNDSSRAGRALAHIVKMEVKSKMREHNYLRAQEHPEHVFANLSQHHENYGEIPADQMTRMLAKKSS